ncbi:CHAD domain-containing protein [Trichloromonas sp.]|uniref:CHAD domain-containing protein n=1 Tax=Trichloromonas sp. TaxID=3069249 RepID=UPI002A4BCC65|nr:CHAD domain-containing protein [Trichloromonas sp.]
MDYLLPEHFPITRLRDGLRNFAALTAEPLRETRLRYFDSFDWRLYGRGLVLEEETTDGAVDLRLRRLDGLDPLNRIAASAPDFAGELSPGSLRDTLTEIVEMRRLFPLAEIRCAVQRLALLDERQKTVARLTVMDAITGGADAGTGRRLPLRLRSEAVRGYARESRELDRVLRWGLGLQIAPEDLWHTVMRDAGRLPGDYTSKPEFLFAPGQGTEAVIRAIFAHLLDTLERNLEGTRRNLDSEFLHDFRVAIRRTRALLGQLGRLMPKAVRDRFRAEFAWLGTITGPVRDLDVHLLGFDAYRRLLPPDVGPELEPLRALLIAHQQTAQRRLAEELAAPRCRKLFADWRAWLENPAARGGPWPEAAALPLSATANGRIRKMVRRALREGNAIDDRSPPEDLHELRKTCKKLRYLLEFFQSLYPPEAISPLLRALKKLQDNLGEFQDLEVHAHALRTFATAPNAESPLPPKTLLAIGQLSERLRGRQRQVRAEFAARFAAFAEAENRRPVHELFRKEP